MCEKTNAQVALEQAVRWGQGSDNNWGNNWEHTAETMLEWLNENTPEKVDLSK